MTARWDYKVITFPFGWKHAAGTGRLTTPGVGLSPGCQSGIPPNLP